MMKTKEKKKIVPAFFVTHDFKGDGDIFFTCGNVKCRKAARALALYEQERFPISHAINRIIYNCPCNSCKTINQFEVQVAIPLRDQIKPVVKKKESVIKEENARRICFHCGAKRNISEMETVDVKHGRYFQAGREIHLYCCKQARRKSNGYYFLYCNDKETPPSYYH